MTDWKNFFPRCSYIIDNPDIGFTRIAQQIKIQVNFCASYLLSWFGGLIMKFIIIEDGDQNKESHG